MLPFAFLCGMLLSCGGSDAGDTSPYTPPVSNPENPTNPESPNPEQPRQAKYLALGDSYTIGASVCETCRFPMQLEANLEASLVTPTDVATDIIATTGWTTTNLLSAIASAQPESDYELVTLLIGVNNQYQHKPFSVYETEFPQLLMKAISFAKGDPARVIVVSIPDYAYTPWGQGSTNPGQISTEIDQYNTFAMNHAAEMGVTFVNITDITRQGLVSPYLVAPDGLHPSTEAYAQFVTRLAPPALLVLE